MRSFVESVEYLSHNPLAKAVTIIVLAFLAGKVLDAIVSRCLRHWSKKPCDDKLIYYIHSPIRNSVILWGLNMATLTLNIHDQILETTENILLSMIILIWALFCFRISSILLRKAVQNKHTFKMIEERTYPLFDNLAKVLIFLILTYLLIDVWDINASGWLASAGVIGIALGFASKESLSNLFAGVFIIADKPYNVGDTIILDTGDRGRIEHIGIRSTQMLTRDDVIISIPNSIMGNVKIINETQGPTTKSRVHVKVGVAYGENIDKVRSVLIEAAHSVADVICSTPSPRVRLRTFEDSSIQFELLCWIEDPFIRGRVIDQLSCAVYKAFVREGITFPFPQRDIHIKSLPPFLRQHLEKDG